MFQNLGETALRLVEQYGYLALALFTFLEASMLFPLLPSEVVVPGAAALLVGGPVTFALFAAAVVVGTTAGSLFAYHVFGERGRSALAARGGALRVSEDRLERATGWFRRWGESSVLWGRLLPFLRSVVSVPAGLAGMGRRKFTLYSAAARSPSRLSSRRPSRPGCDWPVSPDRNRCGSESNIFTVQMTFYIAIFNIYRSLSVGGAGATRIVVAPSRAREEACETRGVSLICERVRRHRRRTWFETSKGAKRLKSAEGWGGRVQCGCGDSVAQA